jgi:hypothetical protein
MGLFDVFTGGSAKKAAGENKELLYAAQKHGINALDFGREGALGALDTAAGAYAPLTDLATKYGAGTGLYMDSLGVNGAEGNARAVGAFQAGPGYDFAVNQSLDALDRRAASRGLLASGNTTLDTLGTVTGLANQEYGNWQGRLAGLAPLELGATGQAATGIAGANTAKAGVYTGDAANRVGLFTNTAKGVADQNTQAANAAMAANGNMWNFGLQGLKAAAGFLG